MIESGQYGRPLDSNVIKEIEEIMAKTKFGEKEVQNIGISRMVDFFYDKLFYKFLAASTVGGGIFGFAAGVELTSGFNHSWIEFGIRAMVVGTMGIGSTAAGALGSASLSLVLLGLSCVDWDKAGKGFNKYIF